LKNENDFMKNVYDHGILFLKIVGFNETNENILIFEHHANLIITNNAKSK